MKAMKYGGHPKYREEEDNETLHIRAKELLKKLQVESAVLQSQAVKKSDQMRDSNFSEN